MALAMLAEITDGESRGQILTLLNAESIEALRTQANAVWNANYNDDGSVTSILASSLWLNEDIPFNKETLNTLAGNYYASSYQGKMGSQGFNKAHRDWLNKQTGDLLKDYISNIEMPPETIMAIATTIYFKAKWDSEFRKSENTQDVFHAESGDIHTDFMNNTDIYGHYYWGEKFSATSKQLLNSGAMWFILPDEGVSIDELLANEEALSFLSNHEKWEKQKSLRVNLSVPKFDVSSKMDLTKNLKNLGITDCFSVDKANFSPLLSKEQPVFLSQVEHGARVAIDEEGVTAAAYTEMMLAGSAMPPEDEIDFIVNRPFLFIITGEDGTVLFLGVVNQP
jgi:serine protease inhibitor